MRKSMEAGGDPMNEFAGFGKPLILFRCTVEQREEILGTLREALAARPEVVFAYAYGSFLEERPFRDIDVGIYVAIDDERKATSLALDLAMALEVVVRRLFKRGLLSVVPKKLGEMSPYPPVDVRVLKWAPVSFCYHVVRGRLIFCRDEHLRVSWTAGVISRYLDSKPLRHKALKEAMLSWG